MPNNYNIDETIYPGYKNKNIKTGYLVDSIEGGMHF